MARSSQEFPLATLASMILFCSCECCRCKPQELCCAAHQLWSHPPRQPPVSIFGSPCRCCCHPSHQQTSPAHLCGFCKPPSHLNVQISQIWRRRSEGYQHPTCVMSMGGWVEGGDPTLHFPISKPGHNHIFRPWRIPLACTCSAAPRTAWFSIPFNCSAASSSQIQRGCCSSRCLLLGPCFSCCLLSHPPRTIQAVMRHST